MLGRFLAFYEIEHRKSEQKSAGSIVETSGVSQVASFREHFVLQVAEVALGKQFKAKFKSGLN